MGWPRLPLLPSSYIHQCRRLRYCLFDGPGVGAAVAAYNDAEVQRQKKIVKIRSYSKRALFFTENYLIHVIVP